MYDLLDNYFTIIDGLPEANANLLNYEVVGSIVERDSGIKKGDKLIRHRARLELAYVYFMVKKDFFPTLLIEDKEKKVRERVGMPESWSPDLLIIQLIEMLNEDTLTKQDKLLESAEDIANDYLDFFKEVKDFNRELLKALKVEDVENLTPQEQAERLSKIEQAKAMMSRHVQVAKELSWVIKELDELMVARKIEEKKRARTNLSILETDKKRYIRR